MSLQSGATTTLKLALEELSKIKGRTKGVNYHLLIFDS
jgi:hypothetical protein